MDIERADIYYQSITVIEAQEMLKQITITSYPHMKREECNRLHRRLHKLAYPQTEDQKPLSSEDVASILGGLNGR